MKKCIICNKRTLPFLNAKSKDKKYQIHFMCYWRFITDQLTDEEMESFFIKQIPFHKQPLLEKVE